MLVGAAGGHIAGGIGAVGGVVLHVGCAACAVCANIVVHKRVELAVRHIAERVAACSRIAAIMVSGSIRARNAFVANNVFVCVTHGDDASVAVWLRCVVAAIGVCCARRACGARI